MSFVPPRHSSTVIRFIDCTLPWYYSYLLSTGYLCTAIYDRRTKKDGCPARRRNSRRLNFLTLLSGALAVEPGAGTPHSALKEEMIKHKRQRPQQHSGGRVLPRPRCRTTVYSRFLCLLSACVVGSEAIYAESDPAGQVPEYCTLFHHQVKRTAQR